MVKKRICLDPGHYGSRYNAGAVLGYYESATVWKLTQYEKEYLEQMGIDVVVTRNSINENPDLTVRGKMASGCDLFISNHTNASSTSSTNRVEVIYLTERDDSLVDDRSKDFALQLAKIIQSTMGVDGYKTYSRLSGSDRDGNGVKDDNYYGVLNGSFLAGVPGVIAEHSFHTNVETCRWLMNDSNLRRLAKACAECMASFVGVSVAVDNKTQESSNGTSGNWYRVRRSWEDAKSQIGAFHDISRAKACADANPGYSVFDEAGNRIYPESSFIPYRVRVKTGDLNMRLGATIDSTSVGCVPPGVYTIVEEKIGKVGKSGSEGVWGRLKTERSYNGKRVSVWICLSYTEKVL